MSLSYWGIGERNNSIDPEAVSGNNRGDWKEFSMPLKYVSKVNTPNNDTAHDTSPFGWGERNNTKTLEEMSMSKNSTAVAVAEVALKQMLPSYNSILPANDASANDVHLSNSSVKSESSSDPIMLSMLTTVIVQMDSRCKSMEKDIQMIMSNQDRILKLLEQQQKQ